MILEDYLNLLASGLLLAGGVGLIALTFGLLGYLRKNAKNATIRDLAEHAYAWAELNGKDLIGSERARIAASKLSELLEERGIKLSSERIEALVKLAWTVLEGQKKK